MNLPILTARTQVADYVNALFDVYIIVIFAYIVTTWIFAMGVRVPYSRYTDAVLGFLRDVVEPYLRIFRRVIPPLGGLDLSPILALFVLYFLRSLIVNAIHG